MNRVGKKFHEESSSFYNEKEVRSINYEHQQEPIKDGSPSKENVELSLEVEIADSLKKILTSPKNCTSRLLDVTIIRPKDTESSPQVETNTVAFDKNEIKDLITIIEKQRNEKKRRIEEQKQKLSQKIQGKTFGFRPNSPARQLSVNSDTSRPKSPKTVRINQKPEYIDEVLHKKDIGVKSAPPAFTLQKGKHYFDLKCLKGEMKDAKARMDYAKKLRKYKDIEGRLLELCAASKSRYLDNSKASIAESVLSEKSNLYSQSTPTNLIDQNAQQVYTTQRTFDDLRSKFKCTNPEKTGKPDEPCVCQHCGMIGVLMDSQKGPVLPAVAKNATPWLPNQVEMKASDTRKSSWKENFLSIRNASKTNNNDCILKQINIRLKSLEERVTIQEETAVTRDYFKLIMNKLLMSYKSTGDNVYKKEMSVQAGKSASDPPQNYNAKGYRPNLNFPFRKKPDAYPKPRYEKKRVNYTVNQAMVQQDMSTETVCGDSFVESEISCNTYSKTAFKIDKIDEVEENSDRMNLKEKDVGLWRWGEEVIKPGFDLKNKIMSLLEEKLQTLKANKSARPPSKIETDAGVQVEIVEAKARCSATVDTNSTGINILPENKFFDQRGIMPLKIHSKKECPNDYKLDIRKAMDDTTFKKNIEERKKASHWKKCADQRFRKDKYDSAETSTTASIKRKKRVRYRPSKSEHDIRRMKKKEVYRIETKTFIAQQKPHKDTPSDSSYKSKVKAYHESDFYAPLERKRSNLKSKTLQVSYLNPKASSWYEESISSGSKTSRKAKKYRDKQGKFCLNEKLHYLQELAKSKNVNEEIIWNSIIKQVKKYSHKHKGGTVKIQIPTEALYRIRNPEERVTEIELTLEDLQNVIAKSKANDEQSSVGSANTSTDHRKKLQELHKHLGVMLNKNRTKFGI